MSSGRGSGAWADWRSALVIVKPETVIAWHRKGFRLFWTGRVMAHEITHLLLGTQGHSDLGLMRGHWNTDDLRIASSACLGLPMRSVEVIQKEALRRVLIARNFAFE